MKTTILSDPDRLPKACSDVMWAIDRASQSLGIVIDEVGPGSSTSSTLSVVIGESRVNRHNMAHGGFIFLLADSAFAFACNSHNNLAVAQFCSVTILNHAKKADRLIARGRACLKTVRASTTCRRSIRTRPSPNFAVTRGKFRVRSSRSCRTRMNRTQVLCASAQQVSSKVKSRYEQGRKC